jgi:hypothetical protein
METLKIHIDKVHRFVKKTIKRIHKFIKKYELEIMIVLALIEIIVGIMK